ncbi:hypothetical protein [Entomospira culicis]|uniref:Uncharacterized protein n=1 Tax=Entomospira culicis TaxID=2719989 RepID=A0A968KVZ7_9SPIO|nr:hypothetical protein [Entomospira culicis]NIZ19412.1 hypothetical protein [Entomospira culicis]NIZ69683.1 hypothetical protein [Entomospira culicis]WDI36793.1 hypothetical protein PVA46_05565 [Entomospira culicis]WDI38422.1 hypothetical protein PVA47_05575 [Entomospira culicis]
MTYCRRCRVVIQEESKDRCPLCHQPLLHPEDNERPEDVFSHWRELNKAHEHASFWYVPAPVSTAKIFNFILDFLMLALFSAMIIVATVSVYQLNRFGESRLAIYLPSIALFYSIIILLIVRLYRFSLGAQWLLLINTTLFLFAIDLRDETIKWAFSRGFVIIMGGISPLILLQMLWRYLRIKGLNIIGFSFFAISISLISLDIGISGGGRPQGWSLFTFSSLLFLAMIFIYLHYFAKIRVNFDPIIKAQRKREDLHHER